MRQEHNEFENALGSYWEEEEVFDAKSLTSIKPSKSNKIIQSQSSARKILNRLWHGLSHEHNTSRGHHPA
jgi:hypothetical protein